MKKITVQISEGLGNQLFMYSFAYALSRRFNYNLLVDSTSAYFKKKNLLRPHQTFMLDKFNIPITYATYNLKFDNYYRIFLKKLLIFYDSFKIKKKFFIEKSYKYKNKKIAESFKVINDKLMSDSIYLQGNFENVKYFEDYRDELLKMFVPNKNYTSSQTQTLNKLKNSNSVSIHIRRNRFSDQNSYFNKSNIEKSNIYTRDIVSYVNKSIKFIGNKIENPRFFIWSNDFSNFSEIEQNLDIDEYELINSGDAFEDFCLFKYSKHFIVGPSSFHWWGAWLNEHPSKICLRPSNLNPSNNVEFWPKKWISI